VTGVDISGGQIELARRSVPDAHFLCADMTALEFPDGSFDGICAIYAIIHVPREEQASLLCNFRRMLRPGGIVLLCLGAGDSAGDVEDFHGAPMYWSHYDAETSQAMVCDAGFAILRSELVGDMLPNGSLGGHHLFVLAGCR
jgi:SAM-dependent methyltransferase